MNKKTYYDQYIRSNGNLIYIAIPKCASSSLKEVFKDLGWSTIPKENKNKFENCKLFAVIRHPLDRWISGFTQYFYRNKNNDLKLIYQNIDPYVRNIVYDIHQMKQSEFLSSWPSCKLFKFDNLQTLVNWLNSEGVPIQTLIHKNRSFDFAPKKALYEYVKNSLSIEHKNLLFDYYKDDLILYNQAL
jgi:hypothetical protein